jgi:hypothetical protein
VILKLHEYFIYQLTNIHDEYAKPSQLEDDKFASTTFVFIKLNPEHTTSLINNKTFTSGLILSTFCFCES